MNEDYIYKVGDFHICKGLKYYYYIKLCNFELDCAIAEKMGIQLSEYTEILKQFNAHLNEACEEYFFQIDQMHLNVLTI